MLAALAFTATIPVLAAPSFSLAWSEYPSWSVFGVAHTQKLIDGAPGKQGPIESKWNVDIVLKEAEYDPALRCTERRSAMRFASPRWTL
jgi:hypothetical protein